MSVARRTVSGRLAKAIATLLVLVGLPRIGQAQTQTAQAPPPSTACCSGAPPVQDDQGLLPEPAPLTALANRIRSRFATPHEPKDGIYPRFGSLMPSAGWIDVGPGYRTHFWNDRALLDLSGAVSWREYIHTEGRVELPKVAGDHLTLGAMVIWQDFTQAGYFGSGPQSPLAAWSMYRLRASETSVYGIAHQKEVFSIGVRAGVISRPTISASSGWHNPGHPDTIATFTDATAPGLTQQPRFGQGDILLVIDTRNYGGHPTSGALIRVSASSYRDLDYGQYSFYRYEFSAAEHVQLARTWALGFREATITTDTLGANRVPFYLLPGLSDDNGLRGYAPDRFHDRSLAVFNMESRWSIFAHLDGALFTDIGQVAPRLGDIRRSQLRTSYGAGLRVHTGVGTLVRLDVAHGDEGWRVIAKLSDSLGFPAFRRWATIMPIVP